MHGRIQEALMRRKANGERIYSDADVRATVSGLLFASLEDPPEEADATYLEMLSLAFLEAGVKPGMTPEEAQRAVADYLANNPPNLELLAEINSAFRQG